jgi:glycosyltransferase involved in cell wall biosynthesis
MKIVFVVRHPILDIKGGVPEYIKTLDNYLASKNHEVITLLPKYKTAHHEPRILELGALPYRPIFERGFKRAALLFYILLFTITYNLAVLCFLLKHKKTIDIVHAHEHALLLPSLLAYKLLTHKPLLVTVHGHGARGYFTARSRRERGLFVVLSSKLVFLLENIFFRICDRLVLVHEELLDLYSNFKNTAICIPNPILTTRFLPNTIVRKNTRGELGLSNKKIFLSLGRLSEEKGTLELINAFDLLRKNEDLKDKVLLIVGEGPLKNKVIELIKQKGLWNQVKYCSSVEKQENILNASDAVLFYDALGGTPRVLIESLMCGKPVLATASKDIELNFKKYVFPLSFTPVEIAKDISNFLNVPKNVLNQTSQLGMQYCLEKYDSNVVCNKLLALYSLLCQNAKPVITSTPKGR